MWDRNQDEDICDGVCMIEVFVLSGHFGHFGRFGHFDGVWTFSLIFVIVSCDMFHDQRKIRKQAPGPNPNHPLGFP